jgi:hypothetical protein
MAASKSQQGHCIMQTACDASFAINDLVPMGRRKHSGVASMIKFFGCAAGISGGLHQP